MGDPGNEVIKLSVFVGFAGIATGVKCSWDQIYGIFQKKCLHLESQIALDNNLLLDQDRRGKLKR